MNTPSPELRRIAGEINLHFSQKKRVPSTTNREVLGPAIDEAIKELGLSEEITKLEITKEDLLLWVGIFVGTQESDWED